MKMKTQNNQILIANQTHKTVAPGQRAIQGSVVALTLMFAFGCPSLKADDDDEGQYRRINLVSDVAGAAAVQDPDMKNAWGLSFSTSSPFWVSDNGTGKSTLYSVTNDSSGMMHVSKLGLIVSIPGEGSVNGQLFNGTGQFHKDNFIFSSEDGVISGWRGALGTNAEILVSNSNAVYKGITLAATTNGPVLLAANFRQGLLEAYDGNLQPAGQFSDPRAPFGYAPFNVQAIGNLVFVTFARQDAEKHDDAAGRGRGLIDVFDPNSGKFHRFATGSAAGGKLHQINSPWGIALAPGSFGKHAGQLLVGNFGSGTIMTFEADGKFRGFLTGNDGPLKIDGLWGLAFGNGGSAGTQDTLFFTAGPARESQGLFGAIVPVNENEDENEDKD